MLIRNSISWFAFGKRAVICFKQRLSRHYAGCQTQFGVFMQQNHGPKKFPLLLDKTRLINHRYGTIKQFSLLSTTELIQTLSARNIVQFWKNTGCHRQHNCLQLRSFSTSEKEKVTSTSSELTNEHWGPYLVSRIHSLEELSRFHGYSTLRWGLSIIVAALAGVYFFRDQLRDNVADEVADVASRSMGKSVIGSFQKTSIPPPRRKLETNFSPLHLLTAEISSLGQGGSITKRLIGASK